MISTLLIAAILAAPPEAPVGGPTAYELQHVGRALARAKLQPDMNPMGKTVSFIRAVRFPVMVDFEALPTFPNAVHVVTNEDVVLREVLLEPGQRFDPKALAESVRNLRGMSIFSVVIALPVKGEKPDEVGILLVTRDLWSLRLESAYQFTGGVLDKLLLQLTERNAAGRNKRISARFFLEPLTMSTGGIYVDPRVAGERLMVTAVADARFSRLTDAYDGHRASLGFARPFYDLSQPWGFYLSGRFDDYIARQGQRGAVLAYEGPEGGFLPRVWSNRLIDVEGTLRAQMGSDYILRLGVGAGVLWRDADPVTETGLDGVSQADRDAFIDDVLPPALHWVYPVLTAKFFSNRYQGLRNLSRYGLTEDLRLGPQLSGTMRIPNRAFGADENTISLSGHLLWRETYLGDGVIEGAVGAYTRYQFDDERRVDTLLLVRARGATPSVGIGRIVARGDWTLRRDQETEELMFLGGDNALRGYPSQAFFDVGGDRLRGNVEYRSRPGQWFSFYGGWVLFYDIGALYGGDTPSGLRQNVGVGVRVLMPQANRTAYRLDFAVPTDGSGFMINITGGSGQAVPITPADDSLFQGGVGGLTNQP